MGRENTTRPPLRFVVAAEDAGQRLDLALAERAPELSRRRARTLISGGSVSVDGRRCLVQSRPVLAGQEIVCHLDPFLAAPDEALDPARILHEDAAIVAIDKPSGMPSHPTFARKLGTALQLTEALLRDRAGRKILLWPLHRLDSATSGLLLFAKTQAAARAVNQNFARRRVGKRYLALVHGAPDPGEGEIALALAEGHLRTAVSASGKPATTRYRTIETVRGGALLELEPLTGRMHQLRVHLAAIGHPVLGDTKYGLGQGSAAPRLMLHASVLELPHPSGGQAFRLTSPMPPDFQAHLATLRLNTER